MVLPYVEFSFTLGIFIGPPHDVFAQLFFFLSDTLLNMQPEGCQLAGREDVSLHDSVKESKQRKTGGEIQSPHLTPDSFGTSHKLLALRCTPESWHAVARTSSKAHPAACYIYKTSQQRCDH